MSYTNCKTTYIKDSEIANLPTSLCVYQNKKTYLMVEVNTGYPKGSYLLKVISKPYRSIGKLLNDKKVEASSYPLLQNCIIYNDKIMSAL